MDGYHHSFWTPVLFIVNNFYKRNGMFTEIDVTKLFMVVCSLALLTIIGRGGFFKFLANLIKGAIYVLAISVIAYLIINYPDEAYDHANRFISDMKDIVDSIMA